MHQIFGATVINPVSFLFTTFKFSQALGLVQSIGICKGSSNGLAPSQMESSLGVDQNGLQ